MPFAPNIRGGLLSWNRTGIPEYQASIIFDWKGGVIPASTSPLSRSDTDKQQELYALFKLTTWATSLGLLMVIVLVGLNSSVFPDWLANLLASFSQPLNFSNLVSSISTLWESHRVDWLFDSPEVHIQTNMPQLKLFRQITRSPSHQGCFNSKVNGSSDLRLLARLSTSSRTISTSKTDCKARLVPLKILITEVQRSLATSCIIHSRFSWKRGVGGSALSREISHPEFVYRGNHINFHRCQLKLTRHVFRFPLVLYVHVYFKLPATPLKWKPRTPHLSRHTFQI